MPKDPTISSLDLLGKIAIRKQEAQEKRIKDKGGMIARVLGENTWSKGKNQQFICQRNSFLVDYGYGVIEGEDDSDPTEYEYLEVIYSSKLVFHYGDKTIFAFIPGPWEAEFEAIFDEAYKKSGEIDNAMAKICEEGKVVQNDAEAKRWGL